MNFRRFVKRIIRGLQTHPFVVHKNIVLAMLYRFGIVDARSSCLSTFNTLTQDSGKPQLILSLSNQKIHKTCRYQN